MSAALTLLGKAQAAHVGVGRIGPVCVEAESEEHKGDGEQNPKTEQSQNFVFYFRKQTRIPRESGIRTT